MEATDLCETIFEFMGAPIPTVPIVPEMPAPSTNITHVLQEASLGEKEGASHSPAVETERDPGPLVGPKGAVQDQQLQKEGMMLAFMGNKLGEYNMRGIEAAMAVVDVSKKTGKALNTKSRRKGRVEQSPYKKHSSAKEEASAS